MSFFEVRIKNFQAISDISLSFQQGINVIVGSTNSGKSSIFRAIETAIFNKSGSSFIRRGSSTVGVAIKCDNSFILYKKRGSDCSYNINGVIYNKVGRGQLQAVSDLLNIRDIDICGDSVRLNFMRQMAPPFLLDKSSVKLYQILTESSGSSKIIEIYNKMRSDYKLSEKKLGDLILKQDLYKSDVSLLESRLSVYNSFNDVNSTFIKNYSLYKTYIEIGRGYNNLVEIYYKINEIDIKLDHINKICRIKNKLDKVQRTFKVILECKEDYSNLKEVWVSLTSVQKYLLELNDVWSYISLRLNSVSNIVSILSRSYALLSSRHHLSDVYHQIDDVEDRLVKLRGEIAQFKVCPLCGAPLTDSLHSLINKGEIDNGY